MGIIYRITCTTNGKFYIGSTANKNQRWARHRKDLRDGKHVNKHMQASWNAHGEASFLFECVEEVDTAVDLLVAEQRYLDEHAGKDYCFNWARHAGAPMRGRKGAETPNFGKTMSEEVKDKIRKKVTGPLNASYGIPVPEERKEKIRESNLAYPHKERKHTPEAIAKIAAASKGRPVSDETRAKRSAALMGHEVPLEQRLRISATLSGEGNYWYGKKRPESFKEKIRCPIDAISPEGAITRYESIQAAREVLGLHAPTINRALTSGAALTRGQYAGWVFRRA